MMENNVNIVVPTRNRPQFLRRLLRYFHMLSTRIKIIVSDSSDDCHRHEIEAIVGEYQSQLHLDYMTSDLPVLQKFAHAATMVDTEYLVYCADDDFVLPSSIAACVNFLKDNKDYHAASGIWVQVESHRAFRCSQVRCDQIASPDPIVRFNRYASNWFSNFYAVHRTDLLVKAWEACLPATDYSKARIYPEWLLSQLGVIYGKLAVLSQPHYLFELHCENESSNAPLVTDAESANEQYDRFELTLATELAKASGREMADTIANVRKHYGHMRTGSAIARDYRPAGWRRYQQKLKSHVASLQDNLSINHTKVRRSRRLGPRNPIWQDRQWSLAYQLTQTFPKGILSNSSHVEQRAA